ncbi:MAG: hypothetical protein CFE23_04765 [Flavobacterium sp. BFFFF1]|uniref:M12 family metallo-peptidase n=1 Tax=Flavobacterium sp. BFFFF1 TaxID=2015557 RepID=UPI000BCED0DC|nr:M12 family metallo-peptidase [Flavobacterium sp. BFFFF1]OYU81401.1 MAG: hypothetical protein CFE23_04765 [Flavobacterium sp. BFFFF1]
MKKIILLTAFLFSISFQAQKAVVKDVEKLIAKKAVFKSIQVLTPVTTIDKSRENIVKDAAYAKINMASVNDVVSQKYPTIEVSVPYHNENITVQLYRVEVLAEGFHLDTDKGKNVDYTPGVYYRGMVKDDENSIASFSFYNGQISAIISNQALSNLVIGKLKQAGNVDNYILYEDQNMQVSQDFDCHTDDKNIKGNLDTHRNEAATPQTFKCVSMYYELDYNMYQANGNNIYANADWLIAMFNNVQTLYANETVNIALKSVFMWTAPDPYSGGSSSDYRDQFGTLHGNFDGDVGQLMGVDPGGLGGVAAGIGGICTNSNYSYADIDPYYNDVPTYSWTVQVSTHENGHVFGARHTHACVWNGNNTCIDGCAGYAEGDCAVGPIPSASAKGTIMSYCHLVSGVGISFNNGFGPQVSDAVVSFVNNSSCLSTTCFEACINRVSNVMVSPTSTTSVSVTWSDTNGADQWEVSVTEASSEFELSEIVNTMTYTAIDLIPNAQYRVKVRPVCSEYLYTTFSEKLFTMGNLGVIDNTTIDFAFYPNPTKDVVNISAKTTIDEVMVYNIEGRLLYSKKVNAVDTTVDISSFAAGTYFFKMKSQDKEANFKVLKM